MTNAKVQNLSSFAWSIADILRGDFKQSEYGKIVLPFVVLRRLDCLLEPTKDAVLKAFDSLSKSISGAKYIALFDAFDGITGKFSNRIFACDACLDILATGTDPINECGRHK